ncbi:hypothetical protein BH09SUM1_BH09SUM1_34370 [soil metagenome]
MSEHYHPSSTDADFLPIVDANDVVIGSAARREIHLKKLLHRAVHVVVTNSRGEVLLQLRSHHKDSHPGYWDISVGGHVDLDEGYEEAVVREMREELGVACEAREVARRTAAPESGYEFVRIYEARCEDGFAPNPNEIDELRWVDAQSLLRHAREDHEDTAWRITGSGLRSIREWARATGLPRE